MQLSVIWSNEIRLYNKTQEKNSSKRKENLTDQKQNPQHLHDKARKEDEEKVILLPSVFLRNLAGIFQSFFFNMLQNKIPKIIHILFQTLK